jgi:hypothetical protein
MNDIVNAVSQVLQDHQKIESLSFYKSYQQFSKIYESLIQAGFTKQRESQLETIQGQDNLAAFAYNSTKKVKF